MPIVGHLAENDLNIGDEFREGNVAPGVRNLEFIQIACHEPESFYLGDLPAVEKGLELKGIEKQKLKRKFREPDSLANPAEELFKLTCNVYDKVYGSRAISPHMDLSSKVSDSFKVLISGINGLIKESWLFI